MTVRSIRIVWLCRAALLLVSAAIGWLMYMAQWRRLWCVGWLAGRERAVVAELGSRTERALVFAVVAEAAAVAIGCWILMPPRFSLTARMCVAGLFAAASPLFIFAAVRGL